MAITSYNPSLSRSRFQSYKNWSKILFRADRKLQTTEIEEIQDLLYNQVSKVYSSLYEFYTIVRGCQIIVTRIVATGYECILTEGQVFVELLREGGFFIDTPSLTFTISRTEVSQVGFVFEVQRASDLVDYRNPHTGGAAFGSEGSDRLLASAEVVVSSDSNPYTAGFYPVAIIKPKTPTFISTIEDLGDGRPDIVYYRNGSLTEVFNERTLSTYIKKLIELRLYEMAGNFIGEGMQINVVSSKTARVCHVTISPGVAYVNGIRIQTNYTQFFKVNLTADADNPLVIGKQYLFYLTEKGSIEIASDELDQQFLIDVPSASLALGYLLITGRKGLSLDYKIIPAPTHMPDVAQIRNLQQSNIENNKALANLALEADLLGLTSDTINEKLNGIFIDSFTDLNNTDIFFPEFSASILPAIQAISLPFTSFVKDNRNFTVDQEGSNIIVESILNENNELVPYWSTVAGTESKLNPNRVRNITGSSNIPVFTSNALNLRTSPSIIYKSDENTFINYTHPDIKFLTGLDEPVVIDTPFNDDSYNRAVTVYASGFPANQDNIIVQLNNATISTLDMIKGSQGSSFGSVRADQAGNIAFSFQIPIIPQAETYTVSLSFGGREATTTIRIKDPEVERTTREINSTFVDTLVPKFSTGDGGMSQTFNITSPTMIRGIEATIMDFPELIEGDILNVYITRADSQGRPTTEALGYGSVALSEVAIISEDRPVPAVTRINLNKPISLNRGTYCIVFQTPIDGIALGVNNLSQPRLSDGLTYSDNVDAVNVYRNNAGSWIRANTYDLIDLDIITHNPVSLLSTTVINVVNPVGQLFDVIDINLSVETDSNTFISVYVQDNQGQYQLVENGSFFFTTPLNSTKVRIDVTGTENTHPIINLDNLSFNLLSTGRSAVWISRNQEYETPYNNLSFSVDVYKPDNSTFRFYFSSDQGRSWEEFTEENTTITKETVNNSLPVVKYTFFKNNLGFVVLNNEENQRYNLRYKIEIDMDNLDGLYPFFKNIVSITNAT